MASLEPLLYNMIRNDKARSEALLSPSEVNDIIIVRNNGRIGNMLFLIPFVRQTRRAFPNARLTLMLKWPWQGQFFENMGIDDIVYSHFSAKELPTFLKTLSRLKKQTFDICFTPFGSAEDTIISAQLCARNKVSFDSDKCGVAFTHTVEVPASGEHAAILPLALLTKYVTVELGSDAHCLAFSDGERLRGKLSRQELCDPSQRCIAYFRGARGKKQLSDDTWHKLLKQFERVSPSPITWVEILSPEVPTPLREDVKTYSNKNLRELASFVSFTDGFLCCDTGPLHLADTANVRCYGVYTHTSPVRFGLLTKGSIVIQNLQAFDSATVGSESDETLEVAASLAH